MKASVVALFLLLEVTKALQLDAIGHAPDPSASGKDQQDPNHIGAWGLPSARLPAVPPPAVAALDAIGHAPDPSASGNDQQDPKMNIGAWGLPSAWGPPVPPPKVAPGTGEPLNSGDAFALESEAAPGLFVTVRPADPAQMGTPMAWLDMRHITHGGMGLKSHVTANATFAMHNSEESLIKSGDMIKWTHGPDKQIDLLLALQAENGGEKAYMWPHPIVQKAWNSEEKGDFLIEHAREVDLKGMQGFAGAWGWNDKMKQDPRKGEAIKDGDSVWIRHKSTTGSKAGDWLWMSGDPAEGYHVAFPHHYPGFDGHVKHYAIQHWGKGGNDNHATAQRFTVRKVKAEQIHPSLIQAGPVKPEQIQQVAPKQNWKYGRHWS